MLEGRRKPFSELELHPRDLPGATRGRRCSIHAHPPHATAFGLVGLELGPIAMPELAVSLGAKIPTLPRVMPKEKAGVEAVEKAAREVDAMLLAGNGAFTLGVNLEQALLRMELVEHYAKIVSIARGLGSVSGLSEGELGKLLDARKKAGLGPKPSTR